MRRMLLALLLPVALAACGAAEPVWAPDAEVARATYRHDGPPSLTLVTVINNKSGSGGHSGLIVNGSQRVIFDPAGSFKTPQVPERNDVIIGANPRVLAFYVDYHARPEWHVVMQEVRVSPEVAQRALSLVQNNGAVPKAQCAKSITAILQQLPGFGHVGSTWYPKTAMEDFARTPGVQTRRITDDEEEEGGQVRLEQTDSLD